MQHRNLRARYWRLVLFFGRVTTNIALWDVVLPLLGLPGLARATRPSRYRRIAADFRVMAVRMGGVMIKVGQFLSARLDVLPPEVTQELAGLQDEVPPEDFGAIRQLAESELGTQLESAYDFFDPAPLAAASLGQVHRARLPANAPESAGYRDVVVKIQRPDIADLIDVDLAALRRFGGWLQRYGPIRRRVDVLALINELSNSVHREIDYLAEASNADAFRANFADHRRVRVPRVAWSCTTVRVLTLEDVYAIKISDYPAIEAAGISRAAVAKTLLRTYLKQIFEDHFFHADPHPGNLFVARVPSVSSSDRPSWQLTFVDFGMVGIVPEDLRRGLRDMLVGIGTRNPARVVASYQTLGVILPGADLEGLEKAEARLFDRFWGMSMSELRKVSPAEMRQFAHQFRDVVFSMPFQVPHNLLLLGRALAILSGMCTGLDPNFNVWGQLAPYAQRLLAGEDESRLEPWLDQVGEIIKGLMALPGQTGRILARMERGELEVAAPQVSRQIERLQAAVIELAGIVLFAAFLLAGAVLYDVGKPLPAYVSWGMAVAALVRVASRMRGNME